MDIGDVLLRDAQYNWHERKALLERDAVVLHAPRRHRKDAVRETFALDGRFTCDAVVVSSAHLHSVRLHDMHTGSEFLLDTRSRGKKQIWVELFHQQQRHLDAIQPLSSVSVSPSLSTRQLSTSTLASTATDDLEGVSDHLLEQLVRASTLDAAADKWMRGADVTACIESDEAMSHWVGDQLVQRGVLVACCCSSAHFCDSDSLYRVDRQALVSLLHPHTEQALDALVLATETRSAMRRHGAASVHCTLPCRLASVFATVQQQLVASHSLSGVALVELLVQQCSAFNVATAVVIANEMLARELLQPAAAATRDELGSKQQQQSRALRLDRTSAYVAGLSVATDELDTTTAHTTAAAAATPLHDDFRRAIHEHRVLEQRYNVLLAVVAVLCSIAIIDASGASLPLAVKVAIAAALLAYFVVGDVSSATLHINICQRGDQRAVTAAFMTSPRDARCALAPIDTQAALQTKSIRPPPAAVTAVDPSNSKAQGARPNTVTPTSDDDRSDTRNDDDDAAAPATAAVTLSAETRARDARVHSFRLAIAQAAVVSIDATRVYSDDYLYSVLTVKDRPFAYAVTKIAKCIEWRATYGVDAITLEDVATQLTSGSMYWYGYDFEHRPILWVRGRLKDWKHMAQRRDAEIQAHVFLLEVGSRELMPRGCTTYTVVTDSAKLGPSHMDLRLMHGLLDTCIAHYPDRVGMVHAGPMTRFLTWTIPMLWPFLPVRLRHKVSFMSDCVKDLSKHMPVELIPKHLGGAAEHQLRAVPSNDPNNAMDVLFMIEQQKKRMHAIDERVELVQ